MHVMALFINDSTDALRVISGYTSGGSPVHGDNFTLVHKMPSWGASAKTLSLRASGGNVINWAAGGYNAYAAQRYGAATHASLFIIEEIST